MKIVHGRPFEMKQTRYNAETEAAMQEARDIMNGKKRAKKYSSVDELFAELDAEYEAESRSKKRAGKSANFTY